jgi:hypothetical protein
VASSSLRDAPPSVSWRKALMYTAAATAATADTFDTRQECSWLAGNVQSKSRHQTCAFFLREEDLCIWIHRGALVQT